MIDYSALAFAADRLSGSQRVLFLCHRRPDMDTLGSAAALCVTMRALGAESYCVCDDIPSQKYLSLLPRDMFILITALPGGFLPCLTVAVDVASTSMLGKLADILTHPDLRIDHHRTCESFAKAEFVYPEAAACAEPAAALIALLGGSGQPATDLIFAALSSDTGGFRYPNVTAATHRLAAELLDAGANASAINRVLFEQNTEGELAALSLVYSEMKFFCDRRIALLILPEGEAERRGISEPELSAINSVPNTCAGVLAGGVLRGVGGNRYKLSLRSCTDFSSSRVCAGLGGGGHFTAAGAEYDADSPESALRLLLPLCEAELKLCEDHYISLQKDER